jgi:hypothetical protein
MVKASRRQMALLGLLAAGGVAVLWLRPWKGAAPATAVTPAGKRGAAAAGNVPAIDLERLKAQHAASLAGRRDIFRFGPPPTLAPRPEQHAENRQPLATLPPVTMPPVTVPPSPSAPMMNVKYIGSLENRQGLRVAVLLTDRQEVLTGQTGEVVANRFKIVKIGYESIDIQDLGSDRVRRIPYKGN